MTVSIDMEKCIGCMRCVDECPTEAIYLEQTTLHVRGKCTDCGLCYSNCPTEAITNLSPDRSDHMQ